MSPVRSFRAIAAPAVALIALAPAASAVVTYGVTNQQRLVTWDSSTPGTLLSGLAITGLASNETIQGIDFRPNDGFLYGLGSLNNLYRIDTVTGATSLVSALSIPLNGANFGFDFNPTGPVALRIVSNTDKNYRIGNPAMGGVVTTDGDLAYVAGDPAFGANPNVTHVAYTNSTPGATATTLYGIDASRDTLVRFASPNAGTLQTVGTLGIGAPADVNVFGGFDILAAGNLGFAAVMRVDQSSTMFWSIDLTTGVGTAVGQVGGGEVIHAMALAGGNIPAPASLSLLGLTGLLAARRRR